MTYSNDFQREMVAIHERHRPHADPVRDLEWSVLALCGEAGELANVVKKITRDHEGDIESARFAAISELGDVLVYAAVVAHCLDEYLQDVLDRAEETAARWDARRAEEGS